MFPPLILSTLLEDILDIVVSRPFSSGFSVDAGLGNPSNKFNLERVVSSARFTLCEWTNIPYLFLQRKYRTPRTDPSFFPQGSSNKMPHHSPSAKWVVPMYFKIPSCGVLFKMQTTLSPCLGRFLEKLLSTLPSGELEDGGEWLLLIYKNEITKIS